MSDLRVVIILFCHYFQALLGLYQILDCKDTRITVIGWLSSY